jgi:hypothetical protein
MGERAPDFVVCLDADLFGRLPRRAKVTPQVAFSRVVADLSHRGRTGTSLALAPESGGLGPQHSRNLRTLVALVGRGVVSFQITILKVLAGHPDGRASHADVTKSVAILMSSGADWLDRMKGLAARAPDLSIFSSHYVIQDASGWQITDAGRAFLIAIEAPSVDPLIEPVPEPASVLGPPGDPVSNVIELAHHLEKRRGRAAA